MNFRISYAIRKGWHYRHQLQKYEFDVDLQLMSVREINPAYLAALGVKALVLDYDGVLAAHGEPTPRPEIIAWLQQFCKAYAPNKIYILSNKPTPIRHKFFLDYFPEIDFIIAKRKKPYPDGLEEIIKISGLQPTQVLLVDDRLFTGILATEIAGVQGRWITQPYTNIMARPIIESGLIALRWLEDVAVRYLGGVGS